MKKSNLKGFFVMLICFGSICIFSSKVSATEGPGESISLENVSGESTQSEKYDYMYACIPVFEDVELVLGANGESMISWCTNYKLYSDEIAEIGFQVEFAKHSEFQDAQIFHTNEANFKFQKSLLGKNGGNYYLRVRSCVTNTKGELLYSDWSDTKEISLLAINKHNFPGIYKLLRKGGKSYNQDGKEITEIYDSNGDGWLDEKEQNSVYKLSTVNYSKKKNGVFVSVPYMKISSLKGVEYLPNLMIISLSHYSGTTVDLSQNKVSGLWISGITSNKIKVIAPDAKDIHMEADYSIKFKKMDFLQCSNVVMLSAYGSNGTKTLQLPEEKKNLKILSVSDISVQTLDMNVYVNLQQLYIYKSQLKELKIKKCSEMRYLYFYYCKNIKGIDISSNKKLRGVDIYATKTLTQKAIKSFKKTKVTWEKGKWWYSSKKYKKDMKNLYS